MSCEPLIFDNWDLWSITNKKLKFPAITPSSTVSTGYNYKLTSYNPSEIPVNFSSAKVPTSLIPRETSSVKLGYNSTYNREFSDEELFSSIIDNDVIAKMPPHKKIRVRFGIRNITKGVPNVFTPEEI